MTRYFVYILYSLDIQGYTSCVNIVITSKNKLQFNIFAYLLLFQTSFFKDILHFLQIPFSWLTYS